MTGKLKNIFRYNESLGIFDISEFYNELISIPTENTLTINNKLYLDNIAYEEYFSEEYWWIIAMYNNIIDPVDYEIPVEIKIPDKNKLNELFLKYRKEDK